MNNMKKALALVMSLALAASTFVVGAAYDDVPESHENRIAINLLGDLGVMVGDAGTNDFRPEGTLKRSEAAAIVYRLRTGKTNADSYVGSTGFSDVSDTHWASGYINYCVNQGAIAGYPDGTYKPDQEVTYAEFIKMVVCALNLQKVETTTYIDMNTGVLVSEDKITTNYPNGYISLASDQQITEGIDYLQPNDKITRAEVAQGAYNAIFESYYKLDPKDTDYVKDRNNFYQHLAEQVFKLHRVDGVVTAYEEYGAGSQEDNTFVVNGTEYEYKDFDASLVGQRVYVWEKTPNQTSATDPYVVAVVAHEDNTVTTINTNDLKKDGGDYYYTDAEGKKQTINDLTGTTLMLNGKDYDNKNAADVLAAVAEKKLPVDLTFIDNDNSPKNPSIISIKVYAETEITSVSDDTLYIKAIEDTYSFNDIDPEPDADSAAARQMYADLVADLADANVDVIDLNAGSIDLLNDDDSVNEKVSYYNGIAKEDKVMLYADVNGIVDIRKVEEVSGTVSAMSGSKFRVGDEEVYILVGDEMKDLMSSNNGYDATAYIDPFTGYVINVDEGVGSVEDYYYLHLLSNTWENAHDYSITAYDYEGNKVKLTFKDSDAEQDFEDNCLGGTTLQQYLNNHPVQDSNGSAILDCIGILDVNSKGEIVRWRNNNTAALKADVNYDKDNEYNAKTGYVNINGTRVEVKPSSIVFGVDYAEDRDGNEDRSKIDDVKTYIGSFPSITSQNASVDYYLKNGDDDLKAALVRDKTKGGNTEFTNVIGYVVDESFEYTDDDKGYAIYTIASKGEVKEYQTEVTDRADLRDKNQYSVKGKLIRYDLTTDGKLLYSDRSDITVLDGEIYNDEHSFKSIVETGTFDVFTNTGICPGNPDIDEDELYFGIVVESKDGKYIRLADESGNNVYIDYADDVKAHVIKNDGTWDAMKGFSVGNIIDSNATFTTYAAVRIADGDDINDARVTEIYAKTIEDNVYGTLSGNADWLKAPSFVSEDAGNEDGTAQEAAEDFLATGDGAVATGKTYNDVLSANTAEEAMALLADNAEDYNAAYTALETAWTALSDEAKALVAEQVGKENAEAVTTFLGEIDAAIAKLEDETGELDDEIGDIKDQFNDENVTLPNNNEPVNVGGEMGLEDGESISLDGVLTQTRSIASGIGTIDIDGVTYTIVNTKPANPGEIALEAYDEEKGYTYGATVQGPGSARLVMVVAENVTGEFAIPMKMTQITTDEQTGETVEKTQSFEVNVTVSENAELTDEEKLANNQKLVDAAVKKANIQKTATAPDFNNTAANEVLVEAIVKDANGTTFAYTITDTEQKYVTIDAETGNIVKAEDAPALEAGKDATVNVTITATLGDTETTKATATETIVLTLVAPETPAVDPDQTTVNEVIASVPATYAVSADDFTGVTDGEDVLTGLTFDAKGATITYAINTEDAGTAADYITATGGKIVKAADATAPADADVTVTIDVTASLNGKTATGSFELTLKKADTPAVDPDQTTVNEVIASVPATYAVSADDFTGVTDGEDVLTGLTFDAKGATITYAINTEDAGTAADYITATGGKIVKAADATAPVGSDVTVTIDVTASLNGKEAKGSFELTLKATTTNPEEEDLQKINDAVDSVAKIFTDATTYFQAPTPADVEDLSSAGTVSFDATANNVDFTKCELDFTNVLGTKGTATNSGSATGVSLSTSDNKKITFAVTQSSATLDGLSIVVTLTKGDLGLTSETAPATVQITINLKGTVIDDGTAAATEFLGESNTVDSTKTYKEVLNNASVETAATYLTGIEELGEIKTAWEALSPAAQSKVTAQLTNLSGTTVAQQMGKIAGEIFLASETDKSSTTYKTALNIASGSDVTVSNLADADTGYQAALDKMKTAWEALKGEEEAEAWEGAQAYVASQLTTLNASATAETVTAQIGKLQNAIDGTVLNTLLGKIENVFDSNDQWKDGLTFTDLATDGSAIGTEEEEPATNKVTIAEPIMVADTKNFTSEYTLDITSLVNTSTASVDGYEVTKITAADSSATTFKVAEAGQDPSKTYTLTIETSSSIASATMAVEVTVNGKSYTLNFTFADYSAG